VGVLKDAGWWVTEGQRCVIDDPATVAVRARACGMVSVCVCGGACGCGCVGGGVCVYVRGCEFPGFIMTGSWSTRDGDGE
jgi:hypothetical protein